jgi:uncharacterized protein
MRVPLKRVVPMLAIVVLAACAQGSGPRVAIVAPDGAPRATVRVEIADTSERRDLGLMYRTQLDQDAGMVFLFPAQVKQNFWMKNTPIGLDMIFADTAGKIVGIVANAQPYSQDYLSVDAASQYVVEVNAGFCARHGIVAGDQIRFIGFTARARD